MDDKGSRYRVLSLLGRGGMGDVYLALDTRLGRKVALKYLAPELARDPDALRRFENEARAAAELAHPHVAAIHDLDEEGGRRFLVLEYVEGETLQQRLQRGRLSIESTVELAVALGQALAHAHQRGIVHRDIKAANVMLTADGGIKVLDFGLARRAGESQMTMPGTSLGTISHMSPEQAKGLTSDARTDLWALGVVLYECMTGVLPFQAEQPLAVIHRILNDPPTAPHELRADVPEDLERVVLRCLEKDPSARYQRADLLLADLRATLAPGAGSGSHATLSTAAHAVGATASPTSATPTSAPSTSATPTSAPSTSALSTSARAGRWRGLTVTALVYAAVVAALTGASALLVGTLKLSPLWPRVVAVALSLMAPAILFIAWQHRAQPTSWGAGRRAAILATNAALAVALLFGMFRGHDLGAITTTLAVQDEQGQTSLHVVPKKAYRKQVTLFAFDAPGEQPDARWAAFGVIDLLSLDLQQDPFVTAWQPSQFIDRLRAADHPDGTGLGPALQRKIATELFSPYFLTGSVAKEGPGWTATTVLHDTDQGQTVTEHSFRAADLFALVDQISLQLRKDLDLPAGHIAEQRDAPVAELATSSEEAFRAFSEGAAAISQRNDYAAATPLMEHAVELDPGFALAHFVRFVIYANSHDETKTEAAIEATMKGLYRLPEPSQFAIKGAYYFNIKKDPDKALAVSQMWAQLHPDDAQAHRQVASFLYMRGQKREAAAEFERILELDAGQRSLLHEIGAIYQELGDLAKAETYYQRYARESPSDARSFTSLAELHEDMGKLDVALADVEKALLLDANDVNAEITRARLLRKSGRASEATAALEDAARGATGASDKAAVDEALAAQLRGMGQLQKSLQARESWLRASVEVLPPAQLAVVRLMSLDYLAAAGRADEAWRQVDEVRSALPPIIQELGAMGRLRIHLELAQGESALVYLPRVEHFVDTFKMETLRPRCVQSRGRVEELGGRYKEAIAQFERVLQLQPGDGDALRRLGSCYRKLGELDKATDYLRQCLAKDPFDPRANLEQALLLQQQGDRAAAITHVQRALAIWSSADAGFKPAEQARKLLAELQASS